MFASGRLIIASGPALCSPLNGVGAVDVAKPQAAASFGSLNQKPRSKVSVGGEPTHRVEAEDLIEQDGLE